MTTTEKLQRIRARCVALLAIAEKRTPGKWIHDKSRETIGDITTEDLDGIAQAQERISESGNGRAAQNIMRDKNASYIAACAGAAEAGWRATIAAIDGLTRGVNGWEDYGTIRDIIAAWPEDLV